MATKNSEFFDIKGTLNQYIKHWWWFVISVVVCGGLTFAYLKSKNPIFEVDANVIVNNENATGSMTSMSGLSDIFGSNARVDDEVFVITSHSMLREVVKDLGFNVMHTQKTGLLRSNIAYPEYPVTVVPENANICDTLSTGITFKAKVQKDLTADITVKADGDKIASVDGEKLPVKISTVYGNFIVKATDNFPKPDKNGKFKTVKTSIYITGYNSAAEDLGDVVDCAQASKRSNLIKLWIKTTNTKFGEAVLDALIKSYNDYYINYATEQGIKTQDFIDERIALISGDLNTAENQIQNYKKGQGIVDVAAETAYNMQMRSTAEQALVKAQVNSDLIKMARDFLSQPQNQYELIPASGEIPEAQSSISQYNNLILARMNLLQNAKGNNKALKQLERQIDALRDVINVSLNSAYDASLISIRDARTQANKALGKLGNVPTQEREFLGLKRQQEVKQQLYLFLLERREETAMLLANSEPKARIVDNAFTLSRPLGMSKAIILLFVCFFALFIPPVIIFVRQKLRNKFESREEVEKLTDIPVLGEICVDHSGRNVVVNERDTSSTTELFRLVRTSLQFILRGQDDKVILVTSTRSGEGKSFVSVNLASSLSLLGKRVCLIGMDIRSPQIAHYLKISNAKGLTVYLSNNNVSIDDITTKYPETPGLDVIVAGPIPPNPGELLTSERVDKLFEELRKRYDYIVVDSAPIGMVSDTFNLARIADATIYVCRVNYTTVTDINFLNKVYADKRLPKMSLVVNGTHSSTGYGYGYGEKHVHHEN